MLIRARCSLELQVYETSHLFKTNTFVEPARARVVGAHEERHDLALGTEAPRDRGGHRAAEPAAPAGLADEDVRDLADDARVEVDARRGYDLVTLEHPDVGACREA